MERDPMLQERWQEKAEHEHGDEHAEKGVDLYYTFLERAQKDATLEPLTKNLERAIGEYADAFIRWSQAKMAGDISMIEAADRHRLLVHNTVIDAVNGISRWYGKRKIDNKWRSDIIGLDRKDLGNWALSVARDVLGKHLEG